MKGICKNEFFDNQEIKNISKAFEDNNKSHFSKNHFKGDTGILLISRNTLIL